MFHLIIYIIIYLLCINISNCMIVTIRNENIIQNKLISRDVIVDITLTDSNEIQLYNDTLVQICFTINGHKCECFYRYGSLDIIPTLSNACVRTNTNTNSNTNSEGKGTDIDIEYNANHYWFGVTVIITCYR